MSHEELRTEYERLKARAAQVMARATPMQADPGELRQLVERLQELNREYDQKLAETQAEMADAQAELASTQAQLAEAEARIAELQRELFGPKAERLTPEQQDKMNQLIRDLQAETDRPPAESGQVLQDEEPANREKRRRAARHPLPDHLETETVTIEPERTSCPGCGQVPRRIGEEVTEEMDLVPARLIRRRIVRPKYACNCGEAGVAIAPLPARLIPQSKVGLGLAVHLVLARFDDHLSFYRLEQQFRERQGVVIPRQQMVQWVEHIALWLRPLYDRMWQAMQADCYMQVDETPVKVLDPEVRGKAARGYLWFYAVPGGDVVLEFDPSRGLEPPRKRLKGFSGTIQTDAYEVYQALRRQTPELDRIGCLAHARRHMYKALRENLTEAVWFIVQIRLLYRIEDEIRGRPPDERHAQRQQHAPQIWNALKTRAEELQPALLPKSTLGKAVNYFLNEYEALTGYLRDGRFEIDNNLVENAIRPAAVGRRRWLFIGHPDAGWRSAVIYSILLSCRRRGINPQDYLTDVLRCLPTHKINQIDALLPANWESAPANTS
ncbi:MAG: IS66 family transposase [Acidobacteria bacterium]|nr:IS66 family transposase [Acidobacteriota bacterium]